jgi:hypothetical protein
MIYPDIPLEQRVLIFKVDRDDEVIDKIYEKIRKCRVFLQEFSQMHQDFNK